MYGGQFAKAAYGIEGDPSAFAEVQTNINLNPLSRNIHVLPFCVGTERSVMEMRSAQSGNSCSGLGKVACGSVSQTWSVQCFPLLDFFQHWDLEPSSNVFIKIDVESFECKLLPTLLPWFLPLINNKPTLYISMHSLVDPCSAVEYESIVKLIKLYRYSSCMGQPIATNSEFNCTAGEMLLSDIYRPVW